MEVLGSLKNPLVWGNKQCAYRRLENASCCYGTGLCTVWCQEALEVKVKERSFVSIISLQTNL